MDNTNLIKLTKIIYFLTIAISIINADLSETNPRIIGGKEVDIAKHPHLVSIRYKSAFSEYLHRCSGSIYTPTVIITSAQCINIGERAVAVVGATTRNGTDGMMYPIKSWIHHPNYSNFTVDYDIGLIFLEDPLPLDRFDVATINVMEQRPLSGKMAVVAGWGYREEQGSSAYKLEEVDVPFLSNEDCTKAYGEGEVTDRMVCAGYNAGGKDACQGDTGSGLIYNRTLVGLVSWGRGCGRPGYPGVYTFVGSLKSWIDSTIESTL